MGLRAVPEGHLWNPPFPLTFELKKVFLRRPDPWLENTFLLFLLLLLFYLKKYEHYLKVTDSHTRGGGTTYLTTSRGLPPRQLKKPQAAWDYLTTPPTSLYIAWDADFDASYKGFLYIDHSFDLRPYLKSQRGGRGDYLPLTTTTLGSR